MPLQRESPQSKDTRFLSSAQGAYRELPEGVHEGLLLGEDGALLEGLSSNVFAVVDGVLRTEDARALHGTTRALVLELARGMVPVSFEAIRKTEVGKAAEMFLTSVSREVLGVVRVDDGDDRPGKAGAAGEGAEEALPRAHAGGGRAPAAAVTPVTSRPICRCPPDRITSGNGIRSLSWLESSAQMFSTVGNSSTSFQCRWSYFCSTSRRAQLEVVEVTTIPPRSFSPSITTSTL